MSMAETGTMIIPLISPLGMLAVSAISMILDGFKICLAFFERVKFFPDRMGKCATTILEKSVSTEAAKSDIRSGFRVGGIKNWCTATRKRLSK